MRHKTIDVPPYKHTFRVFNKVLKEFSEVFEDLISAVEYAVRHTIGSRRMTWWWVEKKISYVIHTEGYTYYYGRDIPPALNVIVNDLGDPVTKEEVRDSLVGYKSKTSEDRRKYTNEVSKRMLRISGSSNKIKQSCEHVPWYWRDELSYSNKVLGSHARPGTLREKKDTEGHIDEYGAEMVRGARRPKQLRDTYDDKPISMWAVQNSWKHHSKRRKQWIPK